jgi:RNA polymerase sigma factor (sigma-70 family)
MNPALPEHDRSTIADPGERAELDQLTARFAHRVRYFVRRFEARFGLDPQWHDDLVSAGYWGLLKALRNRRDGAHEHELSAYVSRRIEGAVLDEGRRVLSRITARADCELEDLEAGLSGALCPVEWDADASRFDPEDLADRRGRWRSIERTVDHLGVDHRHLLWAYAAGRSISEIARSDGLSPARLQNQMTKISRQIRARSPELRRLLRHEL